MAKNLEDPEFWLPSDFLCDDFFVDGGEKRRSEAQAAGVGDVCFSGELPYGFGSNPPSPVDSVTGTESDEDDYMAGLAQKMAHCFLQDGDKVSSALPCGDNVKMRMMTGSPQSTLSAWSASGKGSPNGPSLVSSPLSSPMEQHKEDPWDVLYEAAGQVMRLRLNEQNVYARGLLGPSRKPFPAPSQNPQKAGCYNSPVLTKQQLQAAQFYHLKQQQLMKQQLSAAWGRQGRARVVGGGGGGGYGGEGRCGGRPLGLPLPLQKQQQPQQHQQGSGMRAVFLTGPGARRESTGTGVFLPRRVGTPTESLKKPACSTVLLPARVVQALNLIPEELGAQQRYPGGFVLDHDSLVGRSNNALSHPKRNLHPQPAAVPSHDILLPPEWTY
ncbi:uncharacterized protein LOC103704103 [Phoenix dactylifera]|uniref:Uncharacterized protein LOC103704103 n=1 Tax=Phoenix dactylifera TaxID=42345 RepID=A0A8B7BU79_PHODC|nr:uncharacterized protein LOC103704103 [Phoenix dactylifera]